MLYFGLTMFLDCGFMRNCPLTILGNSSFESTRQITVEKNKNNRTDTNWTEGHNYLVTQLPSKILPIPIKQSSSELVQTIKTLTCTSYTAIMVIQMQSGWLCCYNRHLSQMVTWNSILGKTLIHACLKPDSCTP